MDGSSTTILSLWMIKVFAVPKSMAMSLEKKSNSPMVFFLALNSIIEG
jgi:hypothetical protein